MKFLWQTLVFYRLKSAFIIKDGIVDNHTDVYYYNWGINSTFTVFHTEINDLFLQITLILYQQIIILLRI